MKTKNILKIIPSFSRENAKKEEILLENQNLPELS